MNTIVDVEVCILQTISVDLKKLFERVMEEAQECDSNWKTLSDFDKAEYMKGEAWDNMEYYLNKIGISEELINLITEENIEYLSDKLNILIDEKLC